MHFQSTIVCIAAALSYGVAASPVVRERGTGTEILLPYLASQFKQVFGSPPVCGQYFPGEFMAAKGNGNSPLPWEVCYAAGTQTFTAADAAVAKCLTNLHFTQKDTCISVWGSSCDNGYIAGGGRIQNSHLSFAGAHTSINSDQSRSIQGAIDALVGTSIRTDSSDGTNYTPVFSAISNVNGVDEVDMWLNYIGETQC